MSHTPMSNTTEHCIMFRDWDSCWTGHRHVLFIETNLCMNLYILFINLIQPLRIFDEVLNPWRSSRISDSWIPRLNPYPPKTNSLLPKNQMVAFNNLPHQSHRGNGLRRAGTLPGDEVRPSAWTITNTHWSVQWVLPLVHCLWIDGSSLIYFLMFLNFSAVEFSALRLSAFPFVVYFPTRCDTHCLVSNRIF